MLRIFLALLVISQSAFAATLDVSRLGGTYELQGQHETASGLRLLADGRFEYFLIVGMLDVSGAGRWCIDGDRVLLTSDPPVVPPRFELRSARLSDAPALRVRVVDAKDRPINQIDVTILSARGTSETGQTIKGEVQFPIDERGIRAVSLSLPTLNQITAAALPAIPFPVDIEKANELTFVLSANDFGKADFRDRALTIATDGALLMSFTGTNETLRYARVDDHE